MLNYNREDYVKTVSELKLLPNIINPIKKLKENNVTFFSTGDTEVFLKLYDSKPL